MERALECDQAEAFRRPGRIVEPPRHFDCAFHGFRAGIGEEHRVRKCLCNQTFGQLLLPRHPVQIGRVPQQSSLLAQSRNEVRVIMPEQRNRDS